MRHDALQSTVTVPGEVEVGRPLRVSLVIRNCSPWTVTVLNPDLGTPPENLAWPLDEDSYRVALLRSFDLISFTVEAPDGSVLPDIGPMPWTTPIMKPDVQLHPGDALELPINVSDFVRIESPGTYHLVVGYGRNHARVWADERLRVLGRPDSPSTV